MAGGSALVISLDFELHWGVCDHTSVEEYRDALLGVREVVPAMLELFARRGIAATWATVGFLFAEDKRELLAHCPEVLPTYNDRKLSPYSLLDEIGPDERRDPFHYAGSLLRMIARTPRQEIASHTFSHYYCLEEGQTAEEFAADLQAVQRIARKYVDRCRSIVFPRNQENPRYLHLLPAHGVEVYRSSPAHWAYTPMAGSEHPVRRAFRLANAYLPLASTSLGGHDDVPLAMPAAVPWTMFLRPYHPRHRLADKLHMQRVRTEMTRAARSGEAFHLWWHPHNFGRYPHASLQSLEGLLDHFDGLRREFGMESQTMLEAGQLGRMREQTEKAGRADPDGPENDAQLGMN